MPLVVLGQKRVLKKSINEAFGQKDWWSPLADTIRTVFLLLLDTIEIAGLLALAWSLKALLDQVALPPLVIGTWEVTATQIIKNFDYGVLVAFLMAQAVRLLIHLFRKPSHG